MSSISKVVVQPGKILHEVLVGSLRARGTTFAEWCRTNNVRASSAKAATYGFSGGDCGRQIIDRMIADAGREVVAEAYRRRMLAEAAKLSTLAEVA